MPQQLIPETTGSLSRDTKFSNAALANVIVGQTDAALKDNLTASGLARSIHGNQTIFIGTRQVTSNNQNPFAISFVDDTIAWYVSDYETGGPDGRGIGLVWDGGDDFYAAFSVDGGGSGLETLASNGWMRSYGSGGGPKVTVLARLDAATGLQDAGLNGQGTFVSSVLSNGRTNSFVPTELGLDASGDVILNANSWFAPRGINRQAMAEVDSSSGSPFEYSIVFDADLGAAQGAAAAAAAAATTTTTTAMTTATTTTTNNTTPATVMTTTPTTT
ncbi:MAG: hypothetical protein F6K30_22305, partial [Cyanothece sp. SIO2G6]|nr:hypothetical protein [Cyanothece sp. SIO2G6]